MMCAECNHNLHYYDDVLGEKVCGACGLIQLVKPFEETVQWRENSSYGTTDRLGSMILETPTKMSYRLKTQNIWSNPYTESDKRMFRLSSMVLSHYSVSTDMRQRVHGYFTALKNEHILRGIPIDERAASLTYYMLKEAGIPVILKQHAIHSRVPKSKISKHAKKIARFFRKSHILSAHNPNNIVVGILDKLSDVSNNYRSKSIMLVEHLTIFFDNRDIRYTTNMICATLWMAAQMEDETQHTQTEVVEKSGNASTIGMRMACKDICESIGISKEKLFTMEVSQFLSGAY